MCIPVYYQCKVVRFQQFICFSSFIVITKKKQRYIRNFGTSHLTRRRSQNISFSSELFVNAIQFLLKHVTLNVLIFDTNKQHEICFMGRVILRALHNKWPCILNTIQLYQMSRKLNIKGYQLIWYSMEIVIFINLPFHRFQSFKTYLQMLRQMVRWILARYTFC